MVPHGSGVLIAAIQHFVLELDVGDTTPAGGFGLRQS
jgi:hypothetical protein